MRSETVFPQRLAASIPSRVHPRLACIELVLHTFRGCIVADSSPVRAWTRQIRDAFSLCLRVPVGWVNQRGGASTLLPWGSALVPHRQTAWRTVLPMDFYRVGAFRVFRASSRCASQAVTITYLPTEGF
ncbi:hypothetical protein TSMEX_004089 [Taenia solium]|eukprot:TsM_001163600 transcript=TsM_001163600 gene=TsM_001163600